MGTFENTPPSTATAREVPPQVIPTRHGFLAVSGLGAEFAIGVVGPSENNVRAQYAEAVDRRREILARP